MENAMMLYAPLGIQRIDDDDDDDDDGDDDDDDDDIYYYNYNVFFGTSW